MLPNWATRRAYLTWSTLIILPRLGYGKNFISQKQGEYLGLAGWDKRMAMVKNLWTLGYFTGVSWTTKFQRLKNYLLEDCQCVYSLLWNCPSSKNNSLVTSPRVRSLHVSTGRGDRFITPTQWSAGLFVQFFNCKPQNIRLPWRSFQNAVNKRIWMYAPSEQQIPPWSLQRMSRYLVTNASRNELSYTAKTKVYTTWDLVGQH